MHFPVPVLFPPAVGSFMSLLCLGMETGDGEVAEHISKLARIVVVFLKEWLDG
jgi:hypothetical protein